MSGNSVSHKSLFKNIKNISSGHLNSTCISKTEASLWFCDTHEVNDLLSVAPTYDHGIVVGMCLGHVSAPKLVGIRLWPTSDGVVQTAGRMGARWRT